MAYPLGRIPIIALDYSEADKAVPKEVLIDYENGGNIYVVSADGTQIFDITSRVRELIENGELGSSMIINVEGVGDVQLATYLSWLNQNLISAVPVGCVHTSIPRTQTDLRSTTVKNNNLMIFGFDKALNGEIPVKTDGVIQWADPEELLGQISDPDYTKPSGNNTGDVITVTPDTVGRIVLQVVPYQRTPIINNTATVVLPTETNKQYTKLTWNYISSEENPELVFDGNIVWQSEDDKVITADAVHTFEFETWDGGITWFADTKVYGRPAASDYVTISYLEENVYDKAQVNDFLSWKRKMMME